MLELQILHRLGEFSLEAALAVPKGTVTVLVGGSGAGKSTLLRAVAGLIQPQEGRIALDGQVWFDASSGIRLAPHRRPIGYVSQDYALFPHLSVRDNVGFGPRAMGFPRAEVRERSQRSIGRLGLAPLADRRPGELSGGQQQRVALARALALDPAVLLLDEPLSALDLATRRAIRGELRRILETLPCATLFVTHHPADALAFGDRIAVLEQGRLTQQGTRDDFLRHPRSGYVAEFLGVNLLAGEIRERTGGLASVAVEDAMLTIVDPGRDGAVQLVLHPREIVLSLDRPSGSARNVLRGSVEEMFPEPPGGEQMRVLLATRPALAAQVTRRSAELLNLRPGLAVFASFKAGGIVVLPP